MSGLDRPRLVAALVCASNQSAAVQVIRDDRAQVLRWLISLPGDGEDAISLNMLDSLADSIEQGNHG